MDQFPRVNSDNYCPAFEVGLCYNNLSLLKDALSRAENLCSYKVIDDESDREAIRTTDVHGRVFVARRFRSNTAIVNADEPTIASLCHVSKTCADDSHCRPLCKGISYVEFFVHTMTMMETPWKKLHDSTISSSMHSQLSHMTKSLMSLSSDLERSMRMAKLSNRCYFERECVTTHLRLVLWHVTMILVRIIFVSMLEGMMMTLKWLHQIASKVISYGLT